MKVKCKKCSNIWEYKGEKKPSKKYKVYVTCPRCYTTTLLEEYYPERICFICGNKFKTEEMRKVNIDSEMIKYVCDLCFENMKG